MGEWYIQLPDLLDDTVHELHVNRLKKFDDSQVSSTQSLKDIAANDGTQEYDVHRIVKHKWKDGQLQFLVE